MSLERFVCSSRLLSVSRLRHDRYSGDRIMCFVTSRPSSQAEEARETQKILTQPELNKMVNGHVAARIHAAIRVDTTCTGPAVHWHGAPWAQPCMGVDPVPYHRITPRPTPYHDAGADSARCFCICGPERCRNGGTKRCLVHRLSPT